MPSKKVDYARLCNAVKRSRLALRRFRQERADAVAQYVGSHWSDAGPAKAVPVNLVALYVNGISKNLIAKNPRALLSVKNRSMKPMVAAMQLWVNDEIEHMNLQKCLERVVLDGLFSIGICKVALGSPADASRFSWKLRAGSAFAINIDLDDFVFETEAKDFSEAGFMGHRFRVPLDAIRDDQRYSKVRKKLAPSTNPLYNAEGDERISVMGRTTYGQGVGEMRDMVDLWEIWDPLDNMIYTFPDTGSGEPSCSLGDGDKEMCLLEQRWIGPRKGPYSFLEYAKVPGNAMPKAPIQDLIDVHLFINEAERKLYDQTLRQKEVALVQGGASEDGQRIQQANDGDMIRVDNPNSAQAVSYGGPNPKNFEMVRARIDQAKMMAGNLDMALGLAPQSKTLGQDKLLAESGSRQINDLQERTVDFTEDVIRSLCWFWYHDPFKVMQAQHEIPGLPPIVTEVTPEQRMQGSFEDLRIKIDPYSMQHQTPQARLSTITQVVTQLYAPMAQQAQAQGVVLDMNALFAKVAELSDNPDLSDILKSQPPPEATQQGPSSPGGSQSGGMPANTNREYTRHNVSEQTPSSMANQSIANMHAAESGDMGE